MTFQPLFHCIIPEDKLELYTLVNNSNHNAVSILEKDLGEGRLGHLHFNWVGLSRNIHAMHILEKNLDKVDWDCLSFNTNAIHILEKNLDKVDWCLLSQNPNAIHILEKNLDKVEWDCLSINPNAIPILEKNLDKVDWGFLSSNPNAIPILEKNLDKVNLRSLSQNPNIFTLNTQSMREQCIYFAEELAAYVFHPERVFRIADHFNMEFDKYLLLV